MASRAPEDNGIGIGTRTNKSPFPGGIKGEIKNCR